MKVETYFFHDKLSRMHRSPPGVAKIFPIRKIQRFDKSDRYFTFDNSVLIEIKVVDQYNEEEYKNATI